MALNLQVVEDFNLSPLFQVASQTLLRNQQELAARREQEDKQRAASQKELSGLMSKVNPTGLRQADVAKYNELTSQMRDAAIGAMNASDPEARLQGESKVQELYTQIMHHSTASKELAKQELALGGRLADMDLEEEDKSKYQTYLTTPLDDIPVGAMNPINWDKPADFTYANKVIGTTLKDLVKNVDTELKVGDRVNIGGRSGQQYTYEGELSPELAGAALMQQYDYDRKFKKAIDAQFGDVSPEEAIMTIVAQEQEKGTLTSRGKENIQWAPVPRSSGGAAPGSVGDLSHNVPIRMAGGTVVAPREISFSTSNVVVPSRDAIDADTGEVINLGAFKAETGVKQGNLTGLVELPGYGSRLGGRNDDFVEYQIQVKNTKQFKVEGITLGSDYHTRTFYVRRDQLPTGLGNDKAIQAAAAAFDAGRSTNTTSRGVLD